jgi:hypothetical protein
MQIKLSPYFLLVTLFAVVANEAIGEGRQAPQQPTFVAMVRSDGSMIPMAIWDGRHWWNRWPLFSLPPARLDDIPESWLPPGLRLPTHWLLQRRSGPQSQIQAVRPIRTHRMVDDGIGIQSTGRFTRADVGQGTEAGVAVAGPGVVGHFVKARPDESKRILDQLRGRFREIEQAEIKRWSSEIPEYKSVKLVEVFRSPEAKAAEPVEFIKAYRSFKGQTYYYATGEKLYTMDGTSNIETCKMNMSFEGVVVTDADGGIESESIAASAWAEYCGDRASSMEPIATLEIDDRLVWVVIEHLEDGHNYYVYEPARSEYLPLKEHPFIRVPVVPPSDICQVPELCEFRDRLLKLAADRPGTGVNPLLSSRYKPLPEWVKGARDLVIELNDSRSPAWLALERALSLGGDLERGRLETTFCGPLGRRSNVSFSATQSFMVGAESNETPWVVITRSARIHAEPDDKARVIAEVGSELIAVSEAKSWDDPDFAGSWAKVTWDGETGYIRRSNLYAPYDPGLCLDFEAGQWRILLFTARIQNP